MIVFPFKTAFEHKNGYITEDGDQEGKRLNQDSIWYTKFEDCKCDTSNVGVATCVAKTVTNNHCVYDVTFNNGYTGAAVQTNPVAAVANYTAVSSASVYEITLRNYDDTATHSTIYEKYNDGWYSDSTTETSLLAATIPVRNGYKFRGFYDAVQSDLTQSGGTGTRYITNASTNNLPTYTTFVEDANLYAAWATECTNPVHGTCSLVINADGTATYSASCNDPGYTISNANTAIPTCVANTYSLNYVLNGGHYGTNHPTTATFDTWFNVDNPTHDHATFLGWNITGMDGVTHYYGLSMTTNNYISGTTETSFKNLSAGSGPVTFTAVWDCDSGYTGTNCGVDTYTVTYSCGTGATGNAPADDTVQYNTTPTLPSIQGSCAKVGYTLTGWRADGENTDWVNGTSVWTYTTDKIFIAQWTPISYTMQYTCDDGENGWNFSGTAPTATNPVNYNQNVTLAGNPYSNQGGCRKVKGTQGDANYCDNCFMFGGWAIDAEVSAVPNALPYAASAVVPWGHTGATDWCIVDTDPNGLCSAYSASDIFWLRPLYIPKQYNIEYMYATSPSSGVSNMPANYTYAQGSITISNADQIPPAHATFNGWCTEPDGEGTCWNASQSITITNFDHGDKTYYANWLCDTGYSLSYDTNEQPICTANAIMINYANGGHGTAPASTTCTYGETKQLAAALTEPGYMFDKWTLGNSEFNAGATITCDLNTLGVTDGSVTLTATWTFDPKFTIVTTNMTANDTFSFYVYAKGNFVIDWGDGTIEDITSTTTGNRFISHTYETAGVHNIRIGGLATEYDTALNNSTILFYNSGAFVGTPTKIARVEGSMGSVFPTLGSTSGLQPNFYRTFDGATNLTSVSSTLFSGVTGSFEGMFHATFKGCSKLESIPSGLFTGISGAAVNLFRETFRGCSKITAIPSGLFNGISGSAEKMFYETFFGCSKLASVPSGLFNGVSGSAVELFRETFDSCSDLTTIPSGLFANVSGGAANMFYMTFAYCPKLSGIPSGLFNGVTTAAEGIFAGTFMMDTTLPSIPSGLFANVSGGAASTFWATFYGCTGLSGTIPGNLFNGITTAAGQEFAYTFSDCPNLSGYVPSTLFDGLNGATATDLMTGVFEDSGLAEVCPCGTHQYITGYEDDWSNKVSCVIGVKPNEVWYNDQCLTLCDSGITNLKTNTGISMPILSSKITTHALAVKYNNEVCYVPMESGAANNAINFKYNNLNYHTVGATQTTPANWNPQS